eukprot:TRINITY_DN1862_c0_g1_i1.p1 TRINITY_DN1862_c0_g1~~TRINITY_DN1862_c0_g1_i1.p1  ORF type:complete len:620 (+),score=129.50 TRINITY_DN1862_c0_g1_i1:51-1862(+)
MTDPFRDPLWASMNVMELRNLKAQWEARVLEIDERLENWVDEIEDDQPPADEVTSEKDYDSDLDIKEEKEEPKPCDATIPGTDISASSAIEWPFTEYNNDQPSLWQAINTTDKGRCLIATRHIKRGEVILSDQSILDVPSTTDQCLLSSHFNAMLAKFKAAARDGKAVLPHELKTKELESGVVLLSKVQKEGKDAEQGFTLDPVTVTGVPFQEGVLPVIVQYLECLQNPDSTVNKDIKHLCCPMSDVPPDTAASYLNLSSAFLQAIAPLTSYREKTTVDECVRLLVAVHCNSIGIKRNGLNSIAVFPIASLMQHDCNPNATINILQATADNGGSLLKVTAVRDIPQGTPISISYGGLYSPVSDRRTLLRKTHFFNCTCESCTEAGDVTRAFMKSVSAEEVSCLPETMEEALAFFAACTPTSKRSNPTLVMPIAEGNGAWVEYPNGKHLKRDVPSDNMIIQKYIELERGISNQMAATIKSLSEGDWKPIRELINTLLSTEGSLHVSHHIVTSLLSQALVQSFKQRHVIDLLWIAGLLMRNNLIAAPSAVAGHAELFEIVSRAFAMDGNTENAAEMLRQAKDYLLSMGQGGGLKLRQIEVAMKKL